MCAGPQKQAAPAWYHEVQTYLAASGDGLPHLSRMHMIDSIRGLLATGSNPGEAQ